MPSTPADDAFARLVHQLLMATGGQLESARDLQARSARDGKPLSLGDALVQLGVITTGQRENVEAKLQAQQKGGIQQLLHYKLLRKLGEGGMGTVYLAEDTLLGRKVALKVLPKHFASNANFMKRFHREADALGRLNHPHIVRAFSVGEDQGWDFFVMEYCEGETLDKRLLRDGYLPHDEATAIIRQSAEGLKYAHGQGFIHRDIKPGNIIMAGAVAKILDMGLSKNIEAADELSLTASGAMVGTPYYISPEQARGDKDIDGRSDLYSLGATYFHLVTGSTPFRGSSVVELVTQHVSVDLADPRSIRKTVPDGVVQVIRRMMRKRREDRYADCGDLLVDLERLSRGLEPRASAVAAASAPGRPAAAPAARESHARTTRSVRAPVSGRPVAVKPATVAILGAVAAAVLALVVFLAWKGSPSDDGSTAAPKGGTRRPPVTAGKAAVPPAPPPPDPAADREGAARQMLDDLLRRDARGELSADSLRKGLEAVARTHPDTRAARIARERLDVLVTAVPPAPPPVVPLPPVPVPVTPVPPTPATGSGVDDPGRWKAAVNLVPLIDPAKDAVDGTWTIRNGELLSDLGGASRIAIPYQPAGEYDFRIRFARRGGNGDALQILSQAGRLFVWQMAGSNNTVFGFATVRGQRVASNPTTVRKPSCFENSRVYTSTVQVRRDGVAAFVDGRPICSWKTDGSDLGLYEYWKMRDGTMLGLATCGSAYAFLAVELLDVTGTGRRTR